MGNGPAKWVKIGVNYQGGIVAYILQESDPGYDSNVPHGFIAAQNDLSTGIAWGCSGTTISGADGTAIGTGNQNTIDIEAGCTTAGTAADLCANLVMNGYNDWYLPSKDELNKMYLNKAEIGGFSTAYYLSSSEYSIDRAWAQNFANGTPSNGLKSSISPSVRAIRSF